MNTYQLYGPPKVGADCLSYCGKCKLELAHVVVSMLGGRPARVECKTCRSQHNHKGGAPVARKSSTSSGSTPLRKVTVRVREVWQQKVDASRGKVPINYNVRELFKKGDVIQHTQFGLGFVEEVKLGKITVLFSETEKVLVHGMGSQAAPSQP